MLYKIRNITARYFEIPIAKFLIKLRLSPNLVTLIGLTLAIVSAYFIADTSINNHFLFAAIIMFLSGIMDLFDGAVARLTDNVTKLGAFIDSLSDRIGEIAIFLGLTIYFSMNDNALGASLALVALGGSLTVSYIRAGSFKNRMQNGINGKTRKDYMPFYWLVSGKLVVTYARNNYGHNSSCNYYYFYPKIFNSC